MEREQSGRPDDEGEMTPEALFRAALSKAQGAVGASHHNAKVAFGGTKYNYTSSEQIIKDSTPALAANGLAVTAREYGVDDSSAPPRLRTTYRVHHEGGWSEDYKSTQYIIQDRGRPLDKAMGAAKTSDLGYFLRSLLLVPRIDASDDIEQRDDTKYTPRSDSEPVPSGAEGLRHLEAQYKILINLVDPDKKKKMEDWVEAQSDRGVALGLAVARLREAKA